ncbi:hypothetical protein H0H93_007298 [Arthromyces matolae]|nr:hypothetical protein H0H93_007298 [Arthromyces matolae]
MRTLLRQSILTALIFTNFFLAASTPIPRTDSGLVVPESLNDNETSIINLPISVESDNGLSLLARDPTDEADAKKPNPVTIPPGFLPTNSLSSMHELKMTLPGRQDLILWGSVLNIVNLMDEAARKDPYKLDIPRNTFRKELEKIDYFKSLEALADRVRKDRPGIKWLRQTQWSDLEGLRRGIKEAVLRHNEFEGEIQMPKGFLPENKSLWMKVPYPGNEQAVKSVYLILEVMRSATAKDKWRLADRLSSFRYGLMNKRFKLPLPKPVRPVNGQDWNREIPVIRNFIHRLVEQHNDNKWVQETDLNIAEVQEDSEVPDAHNTDCFPERAPRRRTMKVSKIYYLPKACPRDKYINIPLSDNKEGVESMNEILHFMTYLGGTWENRENWKRRRDILTRFGLEVMPEPNIWPDPPNTEKEEEDRRQMVLDAVTKHNKRQGEWRKEQTRERKRACRMKRPADGPHTQTQPPNLRVGGQQQDAGKEESQLLTDIVGQGMIEGQQDKGRTPPIPPHPVGQGVGAHEHQGQQQPTSGQNFDPIRETFV